MLAMTPIDLLLEKSPSPVVQRVPLEGGVLCPRVPDVSHRHLDGPEPVERFQVLELAEGLDRREEIVGPPRDRENRHLALGDLGRPELILVEGAAQLRQAAAELLDVDRAIRSG